MGATLRVDPDRLRDAARAQTEVGAFVASMATAQSMTRAAAGVPGLLTEAACRFAGSILEVAALAVGDELAAHSANLTTAAARYHQIDEQFRWPAR